MAELSAVYELTDFLNSLKEYGYDMDLFVKNAIQKANPDCTLPASINGMYEIKQLVPLWLLKFVLHLD